MEHTHEAALRADAPHDEGEAGVVAPQRAVFPDGLALSCGRRLAPIEAAYETYGTLAPDQSNVILLCHALSGGAHAAGRHHPDDRKPGWWDLYIGPNKALDTNRFFIICVNVLASPYGTTSPLSIDPATGEPYHLNFPPLRVTDWVELERAVLEMLGIEQIYAVVGGSTGGMRAFEWAVRYPDKVRKALIIAAPARSSPMVIALNHIQRQTILMGLEHDGIQGAARGLMLARMLAHLSYLSEPALWSKFGRDTVPETEFWGVMYQMESYLEYKATTFLQRFDPFCYLYITRAMDTFDLGDTYGGGDLRTALQRVQAEMRFLSFTSDWLFPPSGQQEAVEILQSLGKRAEHVIIDSPWGHDSFLVERVKPQLKPVIKEFLES
ncbi:MAG: homoserine O-acetyltransferase [Fimbriimonadales bacterium]|nr:MAG: homoserine O-acetyltransferase [Fimbriimonadales bacterium]